MRDPNYAAKESKGDLRPPGAEEALADVTRDKKAFTSTIRNRLFSFIRGLVNQDYEQALTMLDAAPASDAEIWNAEKLRAAVDAYHAEHEYIRLDPEARNLRHTYVTPSEDGKFWRVQQMLVDPEDMNDWVVEVQVDLAKSRAAEAPVMWLKRVGELGGV
jgi:hypothetical protein